MRPIVLLLVALATSATAQTPVRRLTTIDTIRQFPAYYHLQTVVLRGEFAEDGTRLLLRSDVHQMRASMDDGVSTTTGPVEVRAHVIDVGRLNQDDPRLGPLAQERREAWPRPGEELVLRVSSVSAAQAATAPSVRAVALEPWRYAGQTITLSGNFRGRNLFGDLPGTPARSRYDFVLRGAEGAIWVTGIRPRGRGFELDVDRRVDSDRWVEVTGAIVQDKGLVVLEAARIALAKAPDQGPPPAPAAPPLAPVPVDVVFNSPTEGETGVRPAETIRIQFSRGLNEKTLEGRIRVTLLGEAADAPGLAHKAVYDGGSRSIAVRIDAPMPAYRTVRVEILEGIKAFDGAPVVPWTLTFSVGG